MNHYGTAEGADTYHAARGRAEWGSASTDARNAALVRGSDYIDQRYRGQAGDCAGPSFPGTKTGGRAQEREWPRTGATDRGGVPIGLDVIPVEVERASYEAALRELRQPGSLSPDFVASSLAIKKKVGPIELAYSDKASGNAPPNRPVVPAIDELLDPVLRARVCGVGVLVV
ncbi:DnaT-like ssDNA-binding protein [Luteimonas fraxinea]|uniref:Putative DnaT-like domain-containing protein n=1 Tax=Luteimonas fraxinea TaxID=2901869 RepID=A0ABS8UBT3_9GAMM|nr:DnaT-like ssDNA-binding protein [Luteimonas fraxinea]MCD9096191.1 hypothetical protein [Luteimonas fraxinea]